MIAPIRSYLIRLPGGSYTEVRARSRKGALRQVFKGSWVARVERFPNDERDYGGVHNNPNCPRLEKA